MCSSMEKVENSSVSIINFILLDFSERKMWKKVRLIAKHLKVMKMEKSIHQVQDKLLPKMGWVLVRVIFKGKRFHLTLKMIIRNDDLELQMMHVKMKWKKIFNK